MNGNITLLVDHDGATLELKDEVSNEKFASIELTPEEFTSLLGRHAYLKCDIKYGHLERVGKKMIMDTLRVEMPSGTAYKDKKTVAGKLVIEQYPAGWAPDLYFGSKDSFISKVGKEYAVTTIRKWIAVGDEIEWT